jgi:stage VI sporulation protein D
LESIDTIGEQEIFLAEDPPAIFQNVFIQPESVPVVVEDKKELKVGFGSKSSSVHDHLQNIKNLIQSDPVGNGGASRVYGDREVAGDTSREGTRGDELEWKKLFLGERGNERSFQKVKLCIVQKEETIDGIAERYSINPREIMLFNRLSNYQIEAGQVIYIPS